ncbi:hypothetical protein BCR34DRAFT_627556 [Clohesyomyces aquaticus]|uniref:Uncharacterized protein n=1 Tax=Clohesyomyces aquaticus TaxID=1231657 RepID=A0A1Y1YXP5_9PLEO|nr:hypothetical protein BCR34DRAFT_627556 [Clohesyomyces aquaticus]
MPVDRSTNNGRPLMPTLATTRTAKNPITPRLAPSIATASASASANPIANSSPAARAGNAALKDDLSTPVKSFLSSNITPRSSSRKSRVGPGSSQSTPNGTPSGTPTNTHAGHGYAGLGLTGLSGAQSSNRTRNTAGGNGGYYTSPSPRHPLASPLGSEAGGARDSSSLFFHANDVQNHEPTPAPPPKKKGPVFFYANGQHDEAQRSPSVPSPPLSSLGRSNSGSKFFHVDSISEAKGHSPILTPPVTVSPEPYINQEPSQKPPPPSLRPPSPAKDNTLFSYRKGASQATRPPLQSRQSGLSALPGHGHAHPPTSQSHVFDFDHDRSARRRSSVGTHASRLGHSKSASLSSIDSPPSLKKTTSNEVPTIIPSPLHNENRIVSFGSLAESVTSAPSPALEHFSLPGSPTPQSPTIQAMSQNSLEHMNELAANARRERKVLDLEISNSSLLAINRSLEKEVRKQKAELRRFRRMSRAGRFSVDTISTNPENFSVTGVGDTGDLSDMSEGDEEQREAAEKVEEDEYSSESSTDEGALSPSALAERDAAHLLKDEKRLQLDLTKHRELLVDSQKMNQSLKRCLNWTEELIKEGQKALAYQVRPADVKIGGRVLDDHLESDVAAESHTLLSPWTPPSRAVDPMEVAGSLADSDRTDRDSGIDVDALKPTVSGLPGDFQPLGSPMSETPSRPPRLAEHFGPTF